MFLRNLDQMTKGLCLAKIDESLKRMKTREKLKLLPLSNNNYLVPLLPNERHKCKADFIPYYDKASFAWWAGSIASIIAVPKLMQRIILSNPSLKHFVADKGALSGQLLISGPSLIVIGAFTSLINESIARQWREQVNPGGFVAADLAQYRAGQDLITNNVELVESYFDEHPDELNERLLAFLNEHEQRELFLWRDMTKGT